MMMSSQPAQTNWDFHFVFPGRPVIYIWLFQFSSLQLSLQLSLTGSANGVAWPRLLVRHQQLLDGTQAADHV